MSEEKEKKIPDTKPDTAEDIVDTNVALLKSKIIKLEDIVATQTDTIEALTSRNNIMKEFIDQDAKAELLADINPRINIPKELLMLKPIDELKNIKGILDKAQAPTFQSGTPLFDVKKESERVKLANVSSDYLASLRRKS